MTGLTSAPLAGQRALSAGTTQRFFLLLILFLASGVQLARDLVYDPHFPGVHAHSDASYGCVLAAGVDPSAPGVELFAPVIRLNAAFNACQARYGWNPPWWPPYAITAGLVAITGLVYLLLAAGRRQVVPVTDVDPGGELAAALGELTATAGRARPPRFVVDPAATTASAVAFGLPRRHTVCLHGALVTRFRSDPEGFRAVVLHEFAHIKNRDVGLTYATMAAWRVYLVTLLLPATVSGAWLLLSAWVFGTNAQSLFRPPVQAQELKSLAETAFLVLLVYLARADVMRARETYADLDAAKWGARTASVPGDGKQPGQLAAFWQLWRTHPGWRQRAAVLTDAAPVFRVSALQTFLAGAATMVILYRFQGDLSPSGVATGGSQYWPGIVAAALITSVVGVALWRAAANAALTASPASAGLRAGLWLGAGLVAGDLTEGGAALYHWLPSEPVFLLALVLFAMVATAWTAQFAALCAGTWPGRGRGIVTVAGLAVTWAAVATWLGWWYNQGYIYALGLPLTSDAAVRILLSGLPGQVITGHHSVLLVITAVISLPAGQEWLLAAAAALLWIAPLLTWAHRARAGSPRLRGVLLAGLGGTGVCWAAVAGVMAYLHSWGIPADQQLGSHVLIFYGCLVACVVAGMVAAAVAAAFMQGSRLLAALVAAGVVARGGLAGAYLLASGDGCITPLDTLVNSCAWRPALGWDLVRTFGALALAVGSTAAAAAALLVMMALAAATRRRARSVSATPDQARPTVPARIGPRAWPGGLLARRTAIAALTAMTITVLAVTMSIPGGQDSETTSTVSDASQLTPATTYTASPQATGVMVAAWLHYGGLQQITVLVDGFNRLGRATEQSNAELEREGGKQGRVPDAEFRTAEAPTVSACAAMTRAARSAEAYFPVPSPPLQLQWQSVLTGFTVGAQGCAAGVSKASVPQLSASLDRMARAGETLNQLLTRLTFIAGHFCRACA